MSETWQWIFSIIGVVAFLMAFPFFLQLLFGQPRICLSFSEDDTGKQGRKIKMHFSNPPVTNWLLQMLRVTRLPAQDFYLLITVFDVSTKKLVTDRFMPEIKLSPSNKGDRVNVPVSILAANVDLARWERSTNSAVLLRYPQPITLKEGIYKFIIEFELDGKTKIFKPSLPTLLFVGKKETEFMWDKSIKKKAYM
jgi:hypothetical protein